MQIQFYQLGMTGMERALPRLLEKAYEAGYRAVVLCGSEEHMEVLNKQLWTFAQAAFLPHGSANDPQPERQPIYLTTRAENPNEANLLVVTDGRQIDAFDARTERLIDMFDGTQDTVLKNARERWQYYAQAGHSLAAQKQGEDGRWQKAEALG